MGDLILFFVIVAVLVAVSMIIERVNRNMLEDYSTMMEADENSKDENSRKKHKFIFFGKHM